MIAQELIRFSVKAREKVLALLAHEGDRYVGVRVAIESPSPLDPRYAIGLIETEEVTALDHVFDAGGFNVAIDPESSMVLEGSRVEWVETLRESGFKLENPNLPPIGSFPPEGPLAERIVTIIENEIDPAVASHSGRIELVEVRDSVAYVRMTGGCQGCGMARVTLTQGVDRVLSEAVPELRAVIDVTDHAAGTRPYL